MAAEREQQYGTDRLQLESVERKIAGIVAAVEAGTYSRVLGERLAELERQQELLRARVGERPPSIVRLHPRLAEVYAEKIQNLERSLNDPDIREEAADILRSLIDRIELHPRSEGKSVDALLYGDLAEILALCASTDDKRKLPRTAVPGSQLSVVAGIGFEPMTFRL
jgi:site-specific DNA recombinase